MMAIAQASVLANDGVKVILIFSNKTKDDIFCDDELFNLTMNPNFKYFHTLTRHDESKHGKWEGLKGRVNMDMLYQCGFPQPADDVYIAFCGPPGFEAATRTFLGNNGYKQGVNYHWEKIKYKFWILIDIIQIENISKDTTLKNLIW